MKYLNLIHLLTILLLLQSLITIAQSPAHPPIVRKQLMLAQFKTRPVSKVDIREINLAPGQKGPLHKHPCPVVGYIVSGTILFQIKGEPEKTLKAGDPFYEPAETVITHFDNASGTTPAKFILNYLMDKEKDFIILLNDKEQPVSAPK